MLNRRGFFGLMGSAAVAGPNAVKTAGAMTLADVDVLGKVANISGVLDDGPGGDMVSYATEQIAKRALRSPAQLKAEKMDMYVQGIDPNVATLRSVALQHKITMSREIAWKQKEARRENYFHGVLKGWFR